MKTSRSSTFLVLLLLLSLVAPLAAAQSWPTFPPDIPSCVGCSQSYDTVCSCSRTKIFQNFSSVLFNPVTFIAGLQCACADSFLKVYTLCLDCFQQTGQMGEDQNCLQTKEPPAVDNVRATCGSTMALFGNASGYNERGAAASVVWRDPGSFTNGLLGTLTVMLFTLAVLIGQWLP